MATSRKPRKRLTRKQLRARRRRRKKILRALILLAMALLLFLILFFIIRGVSSLIKKHDNASTATQKELQTDQKTASAEEDKDGGGGDSENASDSDDSEKGSDGEGEEGEGEEEVEETIDLKPHHEAPTFNPHSVASTTPSNLIMSTDVMANGMLLSGGAGYASASDIQFGLPEEYTEVEGVIGFRGDNFRNNPTYGTANIKNNKMEGKWTVMTSGLSYKNAYWSGSGWTGQPLIVKWPASVKKHMNMYEAAKAKEDLVEVIYACMDGYVYFLDLETGEQTRDKLYLGWTFKGAGALDPRGYPIMYLGAGYDSNSGTSRVFILNLLDCSTMYTFGNNDAFSMRGALSYFDSSALVDAETDTLIYPGENGILYLMKLNTQYDENAGTLSINPGNIVKWHYWGRRSSTANFWLGMEDSACIYKNYIYMCDNGGNMMCLNLNTMQLVWVQDVLDDSNGSPVLSIEDGRLYLYISTSFHLGWRSSTTATVPVWKMDAETGEIIWQKDYTCYSQEGVSGGVQSTIALGQYGLDDYIYVTVSRTGSAYNGVCACIEKKTGEVKWEHTGVYAWSSPVCVYNPDGSGHILYADGGGSLYMLDPETGKALDTFSLSEGVIEASPAVYGDMLVVGTRDSKIWGIKLQ